MKSLSLLSMAVVLAGGGLHPAWAEGKPDLPCAEVAVVLGGPVKANKKKIEVGQGLAAGSRVETAEDSFLKLSLRDGSVLDIGPSSSLVLSRCGEREASPEMDLELELGSVRLNVVPQNKSRRKGFELHTPTSVLGVRGTEFFVSWKKDAQGIISEQIGVSEGKVEVKSLFDTQSPGVSLSTGMEFRAQVRVKPDSNNSQLEMVAPPQVDQFSAQEQREFEQNTKVEQRPLEDSVQMTPKEKKAENKSSETKIEKFLVAKLTEKTNQPERSINSETAVEPKPRPHPGIQDGVGNAMGNNLGNNLGNGFGAIPVYTSAVVVWQASKQDTK